MYALKYEIRYELTRDEKDFTESVAEHVFGMQVLADFFLGYDDANGNLDHAKIHELITWHDVDEIETGDIIGWKKTDDDRANEARAAERVIQNLPEILKNKILKLLQEYEEQKTEEAKFVKAIDKIEPMFHLYNEEGKAWAKNVGLTHDDSLRIKIPYVNYFPHIKQFNDYFHEMMQKEGYFAE